ncbi:phage holin family protein [Gaetbulibacter saemankumensis]|uniref:phage holin family protein n=1 Tax=Gaetbulibacter saemankumensis TaxID=311208 RepID=UPI0004824AE3|nr:phage holin family protein [Gaetbulibacter saemankumensis]
MSLLKSLDNSSTEAKHIVEKYLKTSHQYLRLKIFQQLTLSLSLIIKFFAIGTFVFLAFMFLAITAAIAIGNALDSFTMACLIIAAIFILIALLVYFLRKNIERKIIKAMSIKFFD